MSRQSSGNPNPTNSRQPLRDEPVKIRAASLELREKDKMATFTGDVYVLQGDTEMRCKVLVVSYEADRYAHGQRSHWRRRSDRAMMPKASLIFSLQC